MKKLQALRERGHKKQMFRGLLGFLFGPSKTERVQQEVELRRYSYREGLHGMQPEQYAAASREVGVKAEPQERRTPDANALNRPPSQSEALERAHAVYDRFLELEKQREAARHQSRQGGFEIANDNEGRSLELERRREAIEALKQQVKHRRFEIANDNDMGRER